jgi:hypothetical protein
MKTQPKIYAIRDKITGEYCVFGNKCVWVLPKGKRCCEEI